MTLLEQCQAWHNHGDYEKIIAAMEEIPAAERTPELDGELARAYNNVAQPSEWWYFKKAIDLLAPHAEDSADDHVWNFRMGFAYYYLDQENRALPYFEAALAALPGDEDTEQMMADCRRGLSLPLFSRPFRIRVQEAWLAFSEAEEELRALMDAGLDHGEELIERCSSALHIAFDDVSFELGKGGEKYELILTPEGMRAKLFPLVYFARHAPASVREHWDIHVGRTSSLGFALRTDDYSIEMTDVAVWFAPDGDGVALTVYCEKLLPLLRENENRAWWMLSTIVDQALGEIAAIRLILISSMRRARSRRPCWRICRRHSRRRGTPSRTMQRSTLTTTISPTSASRTHRTMRICGSMSMRATRAFPPSSVPIWIVMRRSWTSTMRMGSRRALSPIR